MCVRAAPLGSGSESSKVTEGPRKWGDASKLGLVLEEGKTRSRSGGATFLLALSNSTELTSLLWLMFLSLGHLPALMLSHKNWKGSASCGALLTSLRLDGRDQHSW